MNYILLAIVTVCCSLQQIFKKAYNVKKAGSVFLFSAVSTFFLYLQHAGAKKLEFFAPYFLLYWNLRKIKTREAMFTRCMCAKWVKRHASFCRKKKKFTEIVKIVVPQKAVFVIYCTYSCEQKYIINE